MRNNNRKYKYSIVETCKIFRLTTITPPKSTASVPYQQTPYLIMCPPFFQNPISYTSSPLRSSRLFNPLTLHPGMCSRTSKYDSIHTVSAHSWFSSHPSSLVLTSSVLAYQPSPHSKSSQLSWHCLSQTTSRLRGVERGFAAAKEKSAIAITVKAFMMLISCEAANL